MPRSPASAPEPGRAATADDVHRLSRFLYGDALGRADGVVHVTSVVAPRSPDRPCEVIAVGTGAPASDYDAFALHFTRARVDVVVTTGAVLRAEPGLHYTIGGPGTLGAALQEWRMTHVGPGSPPLWVLTASSAIDPAHPALAGPMKPTIVTSEETAARLGALHPSVRGLPAPSLRGVIELLRAEGARGISIEAGPSAARDLYAAPLAVDELMLSIVDTDHATPRAGPLWTAAEIARLLPRHRPPRVLPPTPPHRWTFLRRTR
jgi:riboflavin biosynthesis pyrimidine reductase